MVDIKPSDKIPTAKEVARAHTNADTDSNPQSIHHTLGGAPGQASPGSHDHRGGNSIALLGGVTISGSKGGNTAIASIISALVDLGATDATTP